MFIKSLIRINKIRIYETLINELINEENMFDLYDLKKLEENLKTFEIEGEKDIYILGIESSCDDTSAAVLRNEVLLSNVTSSQAVHQSYGGVVP